MLNRSLFLAALTAVAVSASAQLPAPLARALRATSSFSSRELLVKVKPGQATAAAAAYKQMGAKVVRTIPQIGWDVIQIPTSLTAISGRTKLKANTAFTAVTLNYSAHLLDTDVDDPRFDTGEQYSLARMKVPAAWDLSRGSADVTVAVVDTGVDYNHVDLAGKVILGRDTFANDDDPMDIEGHGTHCAGIIGAATNNGIGIAGVGYNTKVLAVKALGNFGEGSEATCAAGIVWAADHGADVISMSIGFDDPSDVLSSAIDYAYSKNCVLLASAGNDGDTSREFPSSLTKVISVAATNSNDQRTGFSQYNPAGGQNDFVDIAAPGQDVLSLKPNNLYVTASGTSMSCPNAAGVASLIIARFKEAGYTPTNVEVRDILEQTCDPIIPGVTFGRVNAFEAVIRTGSPVFEDGIASDPVAQDGTMTGTAASLAEEDGDFVKLFSKKVSGTGTSGSMLTSFATSTITSEELTSATLSFAVSGDRLATLQVFMKNPATGKYDLYSSQQNTVAMKSTTLSIKRSVLQKYMAGSDLNVMIRALVPTRLVSGTAGITTIDRLSVEFKGVRISSNATP